MFRFFLWCSILKNDATIPFGVVELKEWLKAESQPCYFEDIYQGHSNGSSTCSCLSVIVSCKILSFFVMFRNFSSDKCFFFFFLKSNFRMALIWKEGYFWSTFHIFSHQWKDTKIPSAHSLLHTYTHVFCSPYWLYFRLANFAKITNLSCMVSIWCVSRCWLLFSPFWNE